MTEYIDRMPTMHEYAEGKRMKHKPTDLISRADAINAIDKQWFRGINVPICREVRTAIVQIISALPSAEAITIHEDGTLEVKVPNAHKVGRVLVMNTDSHIGGGLFYPESTDAVQGEWKPFDITWGRSIYYCSVCEESTDVPTEMGKPIYNYCPNCGARMKGGAE